MRFALAVAWLMTVGVGCSNAVTQTQRPHEMFAPASDRCDLVASSKAGRACPMRGLLYFDELENTESRLMARMANADATEHNLNVSEDMIAVLRRMVGDSRTYFGGLCAVWADVNEGLHDGGLTPAMLASSVGAPESEDYVGADPAVSLRVWGWGLRLHLSPSIVASVKFARNKTDAWSFAGCTWCDSAGSCVSLPLAP